MNLKLYKYVHLRVISVFLGYICAINNEHKPRQFTIMIMNLTIKEGKRCRMIRKLSIISYLLIIQRSITNEAAIKIELPTVNIDAALSFIVSISSEGDMAISTPESLTTVSLESTSTI